MTEIKTLFLKIKLKFLPFSQLHYNNMMKRDMLQIASYSFANIPSKSKIHVNVQLLLHSTFALFCFCYYNKISAHPALTSTKRWLNCYIELAN